MFQYQLVPQIVDLTDAKRIEFRRVLEAELTDPAFWVRLRDASHEYSDRAEAWLKSFVAAENPDDTEVHRAVAVPHMLGIQEEIVTEAIRALTVCLPAHCSKTPVDYGEIHAKLRNGQTYLCNIIGDCDVRYSLDDSEWDAYETMRLLNLLPDVAWDFLCSAARDAK